MRSPELADHPNRVQRELILMAARQDASARAGRDKN